MLSLAVVLLAVLSVTIVGRALGTAAPPPERAQVQAAADSLSRMAPPPAVHIAPATHRTDEPVLLTVLVLGGVAALCAMLRGVRLRAAREVVPPPGRRRRALLYAYLH